MWLTLPPRSGQPSEQNTRVPMESRTAGECCLSRAALTVDMQCSPAPVMRRYCTVDIRDGTAAR